MRTAMLSALTATTKEQHMAVAVAALEATVPNSSCYIAELKTTADLEPGSIDPALLYHSSDTTHHSSTTSSAFQCKDSDAAGDAISQKRESGVGGGGYGVGLEFGNALGSLSDAAKAALMDLPNFSPGFLHSPLALAAIGGGKRSSSVGAGGARPSSATREGGGGGLDSAVTTDEVVVGGGGGGDSVGSGGQRQQEDIHPSLVFR